LPFVDNQTKKKTFLKTFVHSVVVYGCKTWVMNETDKRFLKAFVVWCWRQMEKNNWAEKVANEDVLTHVGETRSILNVIKR